MANYFDRFDGSQEQSTNFFDQFDTVAKPEQEDGFLRQAADIPLGLAKGVYGGAEMISNLFGAESEVSKNLRGIQGYLNDLMSAQAKQDQQKMAEIMKDAEDKGVADQVIAGIKAFSVAPVDVITQALGTSAPALIAGVASTVLGAPAAIGLGVTTGLGAAMGAGTVKGTIYQETKQALLDAGMSEDQAEKRAMLAQEYGGKNLDQILAGAALGGIAGATGLEKSLVGPVARRIMGKAAAEEAGEEAVKRGLISRTARGAGAEAAPEFSQAAQEQLAANIAAQREGLDVPTMRGVISSGTLEALAGAPLGGIGGALEGGPRAEKPEAEPAPAEQPKPEPIMSIPSVDNQGNPFDVQVVRQPDGTITAIGPDGEEVNIGDLLEDPTDPNQITSAVEDLFGAPPAPAPEPSSTAEPTVTTAPEPGVAPEPEADAGPTVATPEPIAPPETTPSPEGVTGAPTPEPGEATPPEVTTPPGEVTAPPEGVAVPPTGEAPEPGVTPTGPLTTAPIAPKYEVDKPPEQIAKELKPNKTAVGVSKWAVDNAPNPAAKKIAENVFNRLKELEAEKVNVDFKIAPSSRLNKRSLGYVQYHAGKEGVEFKLQLNGPVSPTAAPGGRTGMKYSVVLHELIHAATVLQTTFLKQTNKNVRELKNLFDIVRRQMDADRRNNVGHPAVRKYGRGANIIENPDELLAWGLTDQDFQDYLKNIQLNKKQTAFSKLVEIVRDMLGISGEYQTALESLISTSEKLFAEDIKGIKQQLADRRIKLGPKPEAQRILGKTRRQDEVETKQIVAGRPEAMAEAAEKRAGREMTAEEYADVVAQEKPIWKPEEVRTPNTKEELVGALTSAQRDKVMPKIANNTPVGLRLDINAGRKGVPAITIHEKRSSPTSAGVGKVIGYDSVARVTDVTFANGNENIALKIAKGESKQPLQTIEGRYSSITPEEAVKIAKEAIDSKDWIQVGVDPTRHSFFYDRQTTRPVVSAEEVVQIGDQVFAKNVEYGDAEGYLFSEPGADTSNEARGKTALDVINNLGRAPQPETSKVDWAKSAINSAVENPTLAAETAKAQTKKFLDMLETKVFSSDAALNNEIRRSLKESFGKNPEAMGTLLKISTSQSVHDDALANLFLQMGGLQYDPDLYKYKGVEKEDNLKSLVTQLTKIANKYKLTQEQAQRVAHTAFEAKRLESLQQFNADLKDKISKLRADARNLPTESGRSAARAEIRRKTKDFKYIHMNDGQIAAGLNLFNTIPELTDLVDTWNGMRQNAVKELVDSGLWSEADAEAMLDNVDYVPFYREDQLEQGAGPKEFLRSYLVQAREKKLKGSDKPVNDIFDNMARWTQYAIKRAVRNRQAQSMVNAAVEAGLAKEVKSQSDGKNVVRVWENGEPKFYDMADPLFMDAFKGLESVAIPGWKFMSKMSNLLRQTVVLYPLFSVSQVPQDSFAAMFTSGLKPTKALKIPYLAVKEFVKTVANRSKVHDELKKVGVVGVKDFSAAVARNDAEITAGLKGDRKFWGRVKDLLEHISMASDNAVRQAVYIASKEAKLSDAEAVEKAFQIINFRNKGSLKSLALMGQVIPFFNAYLAAQHVALKTISGRGISPQDRENALQTLAATTASVMMLSFLYAVAVGGDDDYEDTPQAIRDRTFMIPGTSLRIPIRTDIFSIPKILTENLYMLMTDKGTMDGRKFRDSMQAAVFNSVFGPTPVPQAFKPGLEVFLNYNFFQQRPLIGTYQKGLEIERQFNDSTSEFSKLLGQTGLISPIAADHLIRGMFGSAGGLMLALTNPLIDAGTEVKAPDMSLHDMISALPGTSAFVARPNENALKADFYLLRDEVSKVVNTLNDLKKRSPGDIDKYLADEDKIAKLGLQKVVNKVTGHLSKIRQQISMVNQSKDMSPAEKKQLIDELRKAEKDMLKDLDIKELRKMANL